MFLFFITVFPWRNALHPLEEAGEGGNLGELQAVGNLGNA
jgi:hypothetical protein